jgi:23S rRNA (adenine2030-N6)-methyltransferase
MNYRHAFHAGNSADVVKHALLIALVQALQLKPSGLTLIDTHAGCGLYDLQGDEAGRTGEAAGGVLRAFADANPLLDDYRAAVRAENDGGEPRLYPGSPRILAPLQPVGVKLGVGPHDTTSASRTRLGESAIGSGRTSPPPWRVLPPPTSIRRGVGKVF